MPRQSTGKWVQRAASTGGGRTYRGQVPTNWYAALVIIVVLGLASLVYARYEYQHPASASAVAPTVGTTWYAGLDFQVCGSALPSLPASTNASQVGLSTSGDGVVVISPKKAAEAGDNATLGRFVSSYPGLSITATSLRYPGKPVYRNGEACPAGTPDAGRRAVVQVHFWPNLTAKTSQVVSDPPSLKWKPNSFVTVVFGPKGEAATKSSTVELAVLRAATASSTSPSTPGSSSTAPTTTPTTSAPTTAPTTTAPGSKK
ncbi:MAG TPA: hypothetical protein VKV36_12005 [Acidimicrobiales bacterium]|nr:hypothetical protein [Acidimicrobiales bacterium]